ncbi:hypothetical protein [Sphingorhabdus sp. SMR4y]|nr:hypothetical protein [Sphingorhabdus sp. SMR4y]
MTGIDMTGGVFRGDGDGAAEAMALAAGGLGVVMGLSSLSV